MTDRLFDPENAPPVRARAEFVAGMLSKFVLGDEKPTAYTKEQLVKIAGNALVYAEGVASQQKKKT